MNLYVLIHSDRKVCFPADGNFYVLTGLYFNASAERVDDETCRLHVFSQAYTHRAGRWDTSRERCETVVDAQLGKSVSGTYVQCRWQYANGGVNSVETFDATIVTASEAAQYVDEMPVPARFRLMLDLGKSDEAVQMVTDARKELDERGLLYAIDPATVLCVAYDLGIGVPVDAREAFRMACLSTMRDVYAPFAMRGFAPRSIPSMEWYDEQTAGTDSFAYFYLFAHALREEGFEKDYREMILLGAEMYHFNCPRFYAEDNVLPRRYQSMLDHDAAHIHYERGEYDKACTLYGAHLAFLVDGNDRAIRYTESENMGDMWESDWVDVNVENSKVAKTYVERAAEAGDPFAISILAKHN